MLDPKFCTSPTIADQPVWLKLDLDSAVTFSSYDIWAGTYFGQNPIFESLDLAWSLLRAFPKELLKKIPKKTLAAHYARKAQEGAAEEKAN